MNWHHNQGGLVILLVKSCLGKQDNVQLGKHLALEIEPIAASIISPHNLKDDISSFPIEYNSEDHLKPSGKMYSIHVSPFI